MKRLVIATLVFILASCDLPHSDVRHQQAAEAAREAQSLDFSAGNAERENILRRARLVSQPGLTGYVVLLNLGRPIAYYTVRGKVTSSGKRLEAPLQEYGVAGSGANPLGPAPSYDGTYGESDHYVYFWTTQGQYVQWSGDYLYSDQPLQPNSAAADALVTTPARQTTTR